MSLGSRDPNNSGIHKINLFGQYKIYPKSQHLGSVTISSFF